MITYVAIHRKTGERRELTMPSGLSRLSLWIWEYWIESSGTKYFEELPGVHCVNHDLRKNRTSAVQRASKRIEHDYNGRGVRVQIKPM